MLVKHFFATCISTNTLLAEGDPFLSIFLHMLV